MGFDMGNTKAGLIMIFLVISAFTGCTSPGPRSTPTLIPTFAVEFTPTFAQTATPTLTDTPTPTVTLTPTQTPTPTPLLYVLQNTPIPDSLPSITRENAGQVSGIAYWKESNVTDIAWHPREQEMAIATFNGIVIHDVLTRTPIRGLSTTGGVVSISYNPAGTILAAGNQMGTEETGYSGNVDFWRTTDAAPLQLIFDYSRAISNISFSPTGSTFAAALTNPNSEQNTVSLWDTRTWEITRTLQSGSVLDIAYSPDGRLIATSPDRYAIKLWEINSGVLQTTIHTSFTGAVNRIVFSPDGRTFATGHYDGTIRIWDALTYDLLLTIQSEGVIESLAYSPDGSILASGDGFDNFSVRLWDSANGTLLHRLEGHLHGVDNLEFSPDSQFLASASYDGDVRLWGIRP